MRDRFLDPITNRIADFLTAIGLSIRAGEIPAQTVLPGIHVEEGGLVVDEQRLTYPGDLLHEAGHLAVIPAARRLSLAGDTGDDGGEEMAAIAWSYAAVLHIGIPPSVVFHPAGYRGASQSILENFSQGHYFGVPYLVWIGLTGTDYPRMTRWLRE